MSAGSCAFPQNDREQGEKVQVKSQFKKKIGTLCKRKIKEGNDL